MARRAQTSAEYLVILGVVLVLALIAVGVLGGFPSIGPGSAEKAGRAYWSSADIGVESLAIDANGTVIILRNNRQHPVIVTAISLSGTGLGIGQARMDSGLTKTFSGVEVTCGEPGKTFSHRIAITYTDTETDADYAFTGEEPFSGTCAEAIARETPAPAYDWLMYGYGVSRTGFSPGEAPQTNQSMATYSLTSSPIESQPVVEEGIAYVLAIDEMVAFSLTSGERLWNASGGGYTTPLVSGDAVCYGSVGIVCRDKATGALLWEAAPLDGDTFEFTQITAAGGALWLGTAYSAGLYAYNLTTGALLFQENLTPGEAYVTGTSSDGTRVYALVHNDDPSADDVVSTWAGNLSLAWGADLGDSDLPLNRCQAEGSAASAGGLLFVPASSCRLAHHPLFAFNATTGAHVWTANYSVNIDPNYVSPTVAGGLVLIMGGAPDILAYNITTGALVWSAELSSTAWAMSPAAADGFVYAAADTGVLHALNLSTGEEVWRAELVGSGGSYSSPSIARGKLYIGSENGILYEFS